VTSTPAAVVSTLRHRYEVNASATATMHTAAYREWVVPFESAGVAGGCFFAMVSLLAPQTLARGVVE
jgi:hypothetical protein